ncbi:hypothetical protein EDD37DRAFT_612382 [Exophiala viscosa]|uniref:RING-type E3 ubiquitin transferase n=1 Tax=Exophiala viscosa TaxID=2486360 RepID=A0AAN6I9F6_9EURO|nr:hypothetical protein EDD36DRAFT_468761 [Exophiala viscosa]KAI1620923.1 hypothetical protein EDD37DRAFT_612382 [Exophiala viscosa]
MAEQPHDNEITPNTTEPSGSLTAPAAPINTERSTSDHCAICLDEISERAQALPCRHYQFDFPCLGTWLQQSRLCPLCKAQVRAIRYNIGARGGSCIFSLPEPEPASTGRHGARAGSATTRYRRSRQDRPYSREGRYTSSGRTNTAGSEDTSLDFRRHVYRHKLYSLRVGTNRISRYRELTPESFVKDERLTSRARMWVRRELQVFDFLNGESAPSSSRATSDRRASNADFLLEYIIAILKSIDLKGSTGQAEELLKDFLGRDNAGLFLHELEAWLRSPYERLKDWDRAVQYAIPAKVEREISRSGAVCENNEICSPRSERSTTVPRWFSEGFVLRDGNG